MRTVKFGPVGHMFDPDLNRAVARMYEQQGYEFMIWTDQLMLTIPRSLWTPDLAPAAAAWDIDTFMDTWPLMTDAAVHTSSIGIGTTVYDCIRRPPASMAQAALTLHHYAKGRSFLALGAGEVKQFTPYGVPRRKPFAHLEESVKIIKLLMESEGVVDYEGPIWTLDKAVMPLMPYEGRRLPILIAGGPGRAVDIAAQHADGWITYVPTCGTPEWYGEQVRIARDKAEAAGRDPDALISYLLTMNIIEETEAKVDAITQDPIARWDAAAVIPNGAVYEQWGFGEHPIRPDWSYPNHLIPTEWSRQDALEVIERIPPEAVRRARASGTPEAVATELQAYVDQVPEANEVWVNVINYASFFGAGNWGDPAGERDLVLETCNHMRRMGGLALPEPAAPAAAV